MGRRRARTNHLARAAPSRVARLPLSVLEPLRSSSLVVQPGCERGDVPTAATLP